MIFLLIAYFVKRSPLRRIKELIGFKQYNVAIENINKLIKNNIDEADLENLYNLRAICYLHLNCSDECIKDAQHVLLSNSTHSEKVIAYSTLAHIYLKLGFIYKAEENAKFAESQEIFDLINATKKIINDINQYTNDNNSLDYIGLLEKIIDLMPLNNDYKIKRSEIAWNQRDFANYSRFGIELEKKYENDSEIIFRNGVVLLCDSLFENASNKFNLALKISPNSLKYLNASKMIKRIQHLINVVNESIKNNSINDLQNSIFEINNSCEYYCSRNTNFAKMVYLYSSKLMILQNHVEEALSYLNELIDKYPDFIEFKIEKADIDLMLNNFDSAIQKYDILLKDDCITKNDRLIINEKINKAHLLKRQSYFIDFYAFLGLKREKGIEYSEQQIKEAYKKVVRHWHPDIFKDQYKRKEAEKMMKYINAAYDILSDKEKKKLYDEGRDPYNPTKTIDPNSSEYDMNAAEVFSDRYETFFQNIDLFSDDDKERTGPIHIQIEL